MYTHTFEIKFHNDGRIEGEIDLTASPVKIKTHLTTEDIITCTETQRLINSILSNCYNLCLKKEVERIKIIKIQQ